MKKLFLLLVFCFGELLYGQTLSIFNTDGSSFPVIKSSFFALNTANRPVSGLTIGDFSVVENGINRKVLSVTCPGDGNQTAVSIVFVIDASGSMCSGYLSAIKSGMSVWINNLPLPGEYAITSFSENSRLNSDFSSDKSNLYNSLNSLPCSGGTDFNEALLDTLTGGLSIARSGRFKKILVFISDGQTANPSNETNVISIASQYGISIYSLTMGNSVTQFMKNIAEKTGGFAIDSAMTSDDVNAAISRFYEASCGHSPCIIEWESDFYCGSSSVSALIYIPKLNLSKNIHYNAPQSGEAKLEFTPFSVNFKDLQKSVNKDTLIRVTAVNADFNVTAIVPSDMSFQFIPSAFALQKGQYKDLTLRVTPPDSTNRFCRFTAVNDRCETNYYASLKYTGQNSFSNSLKLTSPNGGEIFGAMSDTVITWEGVTPADYVSLEYSTDKGINWNKLTDSATGLKYNWMSLPNTSSNNCLVHVYQKSGNSKGVTENAVLGRPFLTAVALSPDGKNIAWSGSNGNLDILDSTASIVFRHITLLRNIVSELVYTHSGQFLISGTNNGNITVWNAGNGSQIAMFTGHKSKISGLALSPNDQLLASVSDDSCLIVWDLNTNMLLKNIRLSSPVISVAYSPDGNVIACAASDSTIYFYNSANYNLIFISKGKFSTSEALAYSPDGSLLASGGNDGGIWLWESSTGNSIKKIVCNSGPVHSLAFSKNNQTLASAGENGTVKTWLCSTWALSANLQVSDSGVFSVNFFPDNNKVLCAAKDDSISVREPISNRLDTANLYQPFFVNSIDYSPDGSLLATACYNKIKIWNIAGESIADILSGHNSDINSLKFSPDGKTIVSGSSDMTVKFWNRVNGLLLYTITDFTLPVNAVCYSPDGAYTAIASGSGLFLYNSKTYSLYKTFTGHSANIRCIAFHPGGTIIATGGEDNTIILWDIGTGKEIKRLNGHTGWVRSVAFSNDGKLLASGSSDESVILWDVQTLTAVRSFSDHNSYVLSVVFSRDDALLFSSSWDKTTKIWNIASGTLVKTLLRHTEPVSALAFSPTSYKLASGSWDGTAIIWDINRENELEDFSDSLFSIIKPVLNVKSIDFGSVTAGDYKDTIVKLCLLNAASYPATIKSLKISGADAPQFSLISNIPAFVPAGSSSTLEFHFNPQSVGIKNAKLEITTPDSNYISSLTGEGVLKQLEIITKDIDFGKVDVGNFSDTTVLALKNVNTVPVTVTGSSLMGPDNLQFRLLSGGGTFTILPDSVRLVSIRFNPAKPGRTSSTAGFSYSGPGSPLMINLFGNGWYEPFLKVLSDTVDFGIVKKNTSKDSTIIFVQNTSSVPLELTDISITGSDFVIQNGGNAQTLNPDETKSVTIRYKPSTIGNSSGSLQIDFIGKGSPVHSILSGIGFGGTVVIPDDSAYPGDKRTINIILKDAAPDELLNVAYSYSGEIAFENSIIAPDDLSLISNQVTDSAYIKISGRLCAGKPLLGSFGVTAGLGLTEHSVLRLNKFEWIDMSGNTINYSPERYEGTFKILGICHEGGSRLVKAHPSQKLLSLAPNPADEKFYLSASFIEDGRAELYLSNLLGEKIKTIYSDIVSAGGKLELELQTDGLAGGLYSVHYVSDNFHESVILIISR